MITVSILINNKPIFTRTAVRMELNDYKGLEEILPPKVGYRVDDGSIIYHHPEDGAVKLAKEMLDTIKEETVKRKKIIT